MKLTKPHYSSFRVYAEDTDFMGIVYHSNYLCFLERARTEMLRAYGLPLPMLATHDCHFAIHTVQLQYSHPARLDDMLLISTDIARTSACRITFEQRMENQHNTLLCAASITVACIDMAMKPKRLPAIFYKKIDN